MRKFYSFLVLCLVALSSAATDFTKGTFFLNEDWFGHNPSSINFLSEEGEWTYNAFQAANPGRSLGNTCQYATIQDGRIYFVSKQNYDTETLKGGRFVVADAQTLKQIVSIDELNGQDGRAFIAVSDTKGYISTNRGILTYDLKNNTLGESVEGLSGEYGVMLVTDKYLFAVGTSEGLRAIDLQDNHVVKTWENATTITRSKDGAIWYTTGNELIAVDPATLNTVETVTLEGNASIPTNMTWNAGMLFASSQTNTLYWGGKGAGWSGSDNVWKLDLDADVLQPEQIFSLTGTDWTAIYGAAIRINPNTDHIYMQLFKGWGDTDYTVYELDANGKKVAEYPLDKKHYWFPSLVLFPEYNTPSVPTDFTEGVFFVNEDWGGHNPGSVNFLSEDGVWTYNAFQAVNPGRSLGTTCQYASIYRDRIYFVSKQNYDKETLKGGRLVVADAKSLKMIANFDELDGADGRAFIGVNDQKGYISTNKGILTYNIQDNSLGRFVEGLSGEYGTMLVAGNYLFAIGTVEGLRAIDLTTDKLAKTWPGVKQMTRSKDGTVWCYLDGMLQGINPADLSDVKTIELEEEIEHNPWAWNAGLLFASNQTNTLYWGGKGTGWYGSDNVWKLDLNAAIPKAEKIFDLAETGWAAVYGSTMRIDPVTDHIYMQLYKDYGDQNYTVFELDADGNKVNEYPLTKQNCWFPSLPVFTEEGTLNHVSGTPGVDRKSPFTVTDRRLTVRGCAGQAVRLYRMDGVTLATYFIRNEQEVITLNLPAGVYLVQGASHALKFSIR